MKQRRLSIIDLEGGRQPIANEDQTLWVICNGQIYNYQALRQELVQTGHRFRTGSDTEVILLFYEEHGERCVERLRGVFAFAVWDTRRRRLFAARDRLGQKPLYYVHAGSELLFASEIKALLALDPGLARMDLEALHQYLSLRLMAPPRSMFRSIRKLPPAQTLVFEPTGRFEIRRYWDLTYEPKLGGSEEDLIDELEQRLIECIRAHMVSDVPVGAFVSGGMDSTLVAALLMKHVAKAPIATFSVSLPYRECDEAPNARLGAERYWDRASREDPGAVADSDPARADLAPGRALRSAGGLHYTIAKMAREHVKVVLGGDGGDELFGGYDRCYANRYAGYYALLPEAVRRRAIGPILERMPQGAWYKGAPRSRTVARPMRTVSPTSISTTGGSGSCRGKCAQDPAVRPKASRRRGPTPYPEGTAATHRGHRGPIRGCLTPATPAPSQSTRSGACRLRALRNALLLASPDLRTKG